MLTYWQHEGDGWTNPVMTMTRELEDYLGREVVYP